MCIRDRSFFADVGTGPVEIGVPFEFDGGSLLLTPTEYGYQLTAHGCRTHGSLSLYLTVRDPSQPGVEITQRACVFLTRKKDRRLFIPDLYDRWSIYYIRGGDTITFPKFYEYNKYPTHVLTGWRFENKDGQDLGPLTVMPSFDVYAFPQWQAVTPVSYTHLDVYKRQNKRSAPSAWDEVLRVATQIAIFMASLDG